MGFVWVHADSFLRSVPPPLYSFVTTVRLAVNLLQPELSTRRRYSNGLSHVRKGSDSRVVDHDAQLIHRGYCSNRPHAAAMSNMYCGNRVHQPVWGGSRGCASWAVKLCACENSDGWLSGCMGAV